MICSPFGQADFTASTVLQAIRSEVPQLHGLRLAYAANWAREKYGSYYLFSVNYFLWVSWHQILISALIKSTRTVGTGKGREKDGKRTGKGREKGDGVEFRRFFFHLEWTSGMSINK